MFKTLLLASTIGVGFLLTTAPTNRQQAQAHGDAGAVISHLGSTTVPAITQYVWDSITSQTAALYTYLQGVSSDISTNIQRGVVGDAMIADAKSQQEQAMQRDQFRADAEGGRYDGSPTACGGARISAYVPSAGVRVEETRRGLTIANTRWSAGSGGGSPSQGGTRDAAGFVVQQHMFFAQTPETREEILIGNERAVIGMDVSGSTLLAPRTFTQRQGEAAAQFGRNVVDPLPPAQPDTTDNQRWVGAPTDSRAMAAARQAQMSLAHAVMSDADARRRPVAELGAWNREVMSGNGPVAFGNGGSAQGTAALFGDVNGEISWEVLMRADVFRRWGNPAWYGNVVQAAPESMTREIALILAQTNALLYRQNELLQQISLTNAAHYALAVREGEANSRR